MWTLSILLDGHDGHRQMLNPRRQAFPRSTFPSYFTFTGEFAPLPTPLLRYILQHAHEETLGTRSVSSTAIVFSLSVSKSATCFFFVVVAHQSFGSLWAQNQSPRRNMWKFDPFFFSSSPSSWQRFNGVEKVYRVSEMEKDFAGTRTSQTRMCPQDDEVAAYLFAPLLYASTGSRCRATGDKLAKHE